MIYLASVSPRRKELLQKADIPFRIIRSRYRERHDKKCSPEELVRRHALGKARKAVAPKRARFIVGADTIVWCRGRALGKPLNVKEAVEMLQLLSGRGHEVYTGIAILDSQKKKELVSHEKTRVFIRKMNRQSILNYFASVNPFDKAGAYAIQESPRIVTRIRGSRSNVIGLPLALLRSMLSLISRES